MLNISLQISTLSESEKIIIAANIKRLDSDYNCDSIRQSAEENIHKLKKRGMGEDIIKQAREQIENKLPCSRNDLSIKANNYMFSKCLCHYKDSTVTNYLEYYKHYKSGFLPNNGGINQQNAKLIEIISFIDTLFNELENDAREKNVRQNKNQSRHDNRPSKEGT